MGDGMAMTIEFKGGPLDGKTLTIESDWPEPTIIHTIEHPPPNGLEVWRYRLSNYDTDARASYSAPMKLPSVG
jgi:hypothetical protein